MSNKQQILVGESAIGTVHALKQDGSLYCGRAVGTGNIRYNGLTAVTCGSCQMAYDHQHGACADCGGPKQKNWGRLCSACRMYQRRNNGRLRGGLRKLPYVEIPPEKLQALYDEYRLDFCSLDELSRREGISLPTLRTRFEEAEYKLRKRGKQTAQARKKRDRRRFPRRHAFAKPSPRDVTDREYSLLAAIKQARAEGGKLVISRLATTYTGEAAYDALFRLRERGFVTYTRYSDVQLTDLKPRLRPDEQERMSEVYQPGMHSGDLAYTAGVSLGCANRFIKRQMETTPTT